MALENKKPEYVLKGHLKQRLKSLMTSLEGKMRFVSELPSLSHMLSEADSSTCLVVTGAKDLEQVADSGQVKDHHSLVRIIQAIDDPLPSLLVGSDVPDPCSSIFVLNPFDSFAAELAQTCCSQMATGSLDFAAINRWGSRIFSQKISAWNDVGDALPKSHLKASSRRCLQDALTKIEGWLSPDEVSVISDGETDRLVINGGWKGPGDDLWPLISKLNLSLTGVVIVIRPNNQAQVTLYSRCPRYLPDELAGVFVIKEKIETTLNKKNKPGLPDVG